MDIFSLYLMSFFLQPTNGAIAPYIQLVLRNKGLSHSLVGVVSGAGQVAQIVGPLAVAAVAEKLGKERQALFLCTVVGLLFHIPYILSSSVWVTAVCLFIGSAFYWCLNPMTDGYINKYIDGNAETYGKMRSTGTLAYVLFMVMFAVVGFPKETDNRQILLNMVVLLGVFAVTLFFIPKLPERAVRTAEKERLKGEKDRFFGFGNFDRPFYVFMAVAGISRIAMAVVEKLLSAYMTEELGLGGSFTAFVGLGAFGEFLVLLIGGRLVRRGKTNPWGLVMLSCAGLIVRLLMYVFFKSIPMFALAQLLHAFTFGACHLAATSYVSAHVEEERYSTAMTFYWCIADNLPLFIGTIAGGFIIDAFGYNALFISYCVFPAAALVLGFCARGMIMDPEGYMTQRRAVKGRIA